MDMKRAEELVELIDKGVGRDGRDFDDYYSWDDLICDGVLTDDEFTWCQENIEVDLIVEVVLKKGLKFDD